MSDRTVDLDALLVKCSEKVLSAWFYDGKFKAGWRPEPALFLVPAHRAMCEVMAARGPSLTDGGLTLELRRLGRLVLFEGLGAGSDIQGANAVATILHSTPGVLDPWAAVAELRELVALRALRAGLHGALRRVDDGQGLHAVKSAVAGALVAACGVGGADVAPVWAGVADERDRMLGAPRVPGCPTGSRILDRLTGGLRPRDVWIIGAPTSWGKSSYLCSLFRYALARGLRMLIVSGEDPIGLYSQRVITGLTGVNALRARESALLSDERYLVSNVLDGVPDFPFFLDAIGRPAEAVAADIRSTLAASDVPGSGWIVAIDYIQAFRSAQQQQDKRNDMIQCSRLFTDAIKQSGAAGVQFSQVTRDAGGKLKMREAEDLINMSEVGLYGDFEDVPAMDCDGRKLGTTKERRFLVAKIKDGPAGFTVPLSWDQHSASFLENTEEQHAW